MTYHSNENKSCSNAAERVRKVLFNFDLELEASIGELKFHQARIIRFKHAKQGRGLENLMYSRIEEEKLLVYIDHLTQGKNETYQALESVLNTYNPTYKKIFIMHFISHLSHQEIADMTNYSLVHIKRIIKKLKKDLINLDGGETEEQNEHNEES